MEVIDTVAELRLDHVVILVDDLPRAVKNYITLGFNVVPGGEHAGGRTHNAIIPFRDGSYLELVAFKYRWVRPLAVLLRWMRLLDPLVEGRPPLERRFLLRSVAGEGLVDFALLPERIEVELARARRRGLALEGPLAGGRVRPDGAEVAWQLGVPAETGLPFLCCDVTPRHLRVPDGMLRRHPNGALGIAGVDVAVNDLATAVRKYEALLGTPPQPLPVPATEGVRRAVFEKKETNVTLVAPSTAQHGLQREIGARGEGVYAVRLRADARVRDGLLDPVRTHGARLSFVH